MLCVCSVGYMKPRKGRTPRLTMLSSTNGLLLIFNRDVIFSGLHSPATVFPVPQSKHQWSQKSLVEDKGNDKSILYKAIHIAREQSLHKWGTVFSM